jgi:hypothetical protein
MWMGPGPLRLNPSWPIHDYGSLSAFTVPMAHGAYSVFGSNLFFMAQTKRDWPTTGQHVNWLIVQ